MASHRIEELRAAARIMALAARAAGLDPRAAVTFEEPYDEPYDVEPGEPEYETVDPSVPYDYEQIARAA
jgi:hypothetical protein